MNADDPRHGTWAGVKAHDRHGVPMCEPCRIAQYRTNKAAKMRRDRGVLNRIPLGKTAWGILDANTRTEIHHATGLNRNMLSRLHKGGPDIQVLRSTRDRILTSRPAFTPIGIQRRLRALAVIGYSSPYIAGRLDIHPSTLNNLRRREVSFVRHDFAQRIVDLYDELHMTPVDIPTSSTAARTHAKRQGWSAPLDWECIDTDKEAGHAGTEAGIDEVRVRRVLAGHLADCNQAERVAVIERWEGSTNALERLTGWNIHRMLKKEVA